MVNYMISEIILFFAILVFAFMQIDYFKKWKTFKKENKIGKIEIIVDTALVLVADIYLGTVFAGILLKLIN